MFIVFSQLFIGGLLNLQAFVAMLHTGNAICYAVIIIIIDIENFV